MFSGFNLPLDHFDVFFVASKVGSNRESFLLFSAEYREHPWFLAPVDAGEKQKKETSEEPKGEASNNWAIDSTIFTLQLARPTTVEKPIQLLAMQVGGLST